MLKRLDHTAATLSFIKGFYEVVLFGGDSSRTSISSVINETRILRFGKCDSNVINLLGHEFHMKTCTHVNTLLPARASEQGNVIGSVSVYIYIYIYVIKKKL